MPDQRESFGPGRVLAQVTLIVALPLLGGVIAGLVADNVLGTSPLLVLGGLVLGSLVTAGTLYRYITKNAARLRAGAGRRDPAGNERNSAGDS
jgi:hypothetical protein